MLVLEDKIVQRATTGVLNNVYEADFKGFSYGFRPGRSQHNALDALYVGINTQNVNWVLDGDIRGFLTPSPTIGLSSSLSTGLRISAS
jgi:retron-type reverse transcriptase